MRCNKSCRLDFRASRELIAELDAIAAAASQEVVKSTFFSHNQKITRSDIFSYALMKMYAIEPEKLFFNYNANYKIQQIEQAMKKKATPKVASKYTPTATAQAEKSTHKAHGYNTIKGMVEKAKSAGLDGKTVEKVKHIIERVERVWKQFFTDIIKDLEIILKNQRDLAEIEKEKAQR